MPPCRKPAYQTLRISLDEARAEVALLRLQMYRFSCSCKDSEFQRILDCLSLLLSYIQYKENQEKKERRARRQPPSSLTDPDCLRPQGPFLRAKIIKSYVYLSVILWYPTLQVYFALFTVLNSSFFCRLFLPPNIHSVLNPCSISVGHFFGEFLGFLALNHILCQLGGQFQIGQDCFN